MLLILLGFLALGDCDYQWRRCYEGLQLWANFAEAITGPAEAFTDYQVDQNIITEFFHDGSCAGPPAQLACEYAEPAPTFACGEVVTDHPYQCYSVYEGHFYPIRFFDFDGDHDIDLLDFAELQIESNQLDQ